MFKPCHPLRRRMTATAPGHEGDRGGAAGRPGWRAVLRVLAAPAALGLAFGAVTGAVPPASAGTILGCGWQLPGGSCAFTVLPPAARPAHTLYLIANAEGLPIADLEVNPDGTTSHGATGGTTTAGTMAGPPMSSPR